MSLDYLYTAISWILLRWHDAWGAVFGRESDLSWVLSIIFLVITIRLILFPLFVKQIKSQRKMQELQPKMKALQAKHKGDKETLQREMMALYKENGANPVAGCLPIFLQAPVFLSLYHVLKRLDPTKERVETLYGWTTGEFESASVAKLFGAPISANFMSDASYLAEVGASGTTVKLVATVLITIMVATTYITQRQMIAKQQAAGTPTDPQQLMIQRLMLYGIPASLLISGALFPLGVVLYWCTTNVWSMGQQFYVLRRMPMVGAPLPDARPAADSEAPAPKPGVRPQRPKRAGSNAADQAANQAPAKKARLPRAVLQEALPDKPTTSKSAHMESPQAEESDSQSSNGVPASKTDSPDAIEPAGTAAGSARTGAPTKPGARPPTNRAKNRKGGRR